MLVPVVWMSNLAGLDMRLPEDDAFLQRLIAALSVGLAFLLFYRLGALFAKPVASLVVAIAFTFGTSAISTNGLALWSSDLSLLLVTCCLILAWSDDGSSRRRALWVGMALSLAALCRPTAALAAFALLPWAMRNRNRIWIVSATLVSVGALFLFLYRLDTGIWVPNYFRFNRLGGSGGDFWVALAGTLISPSRGLFVFSPQIVPVTVAAAILIRKKCLEALWMFAWILFHWLVVCSFWHWWGGFGFGPRLFTDIIPAFVLLAALSAARLSIGRLWLSSFLLLSAVAIAIHTGQGLFNRATAEWNSEPNVDENPSLIFDWRYPQFAATEASQRSRNLERRVPRELVPERPVFPDSDEVIFENWWDLEEEPDGRLFRWSGPESDLLFRVNWASGLTLNLSSLGRQPVTITLNGSPIAAFDLQAERPTSIELNFSAQGLVRLGFQVPEARSPGGRDPRTLGIRIWSLTVH